MDILRPPIMFYIHYSDSHGSSSAHKQRHLCFNGCESRYIRKILWYTWHHAFLYIIVILYVRLESSWLRILQYLNNFFFVYSAGTPLLTRFHLGISKREMYRENDPVVAELLKELANQPIVSCGKCILSTDVTCWLYSNCARVWLANRSYSLIKGSRIFSNV